LIEAIDIHKHYGDLHVLKGLSCTVAEAEVVAIVGPSGAGKSTFLHILGTLDRPDSGQVRYKGQTPDFAKPKQLAHFRNQNIGFVFQFHHLLPEFTALENTMLPALIAKVSRAEARERALELLKLLGLKDRVGHYPSQLSGGEQQRVAVARALINRPALVLADEPTGNLDSASADELHRLIFSLRLQLGQTFVLVTHNEGLASMADRTLHMYDGTFSEG
jgi:lipoprotein-releasing system ATP-binding protein